MVIKQIHDFLVVAKIHEWLGRRGRKRYRALEASLRAMMGDEDVREKHHPFKRDRLGDILGGLPQHMKSLQVLPLSSAATVCSCLVP
jgi:hypothetical protein